MKKIKNLVTLIAISFVILISSSLAEELNGIVKVLNQEGAWVSGVVIENNEKPIILTCAHMFFLRKTETIQVNFYNKKKEYYSYPADLLKKHDGWDLALIQLRDKVEVKAFPFVDSYPNNARIRIYGYSLNGIEDYYVTLSNAPKQTTQDGEPLVQLKGKGISGLSGTPFLYENQIIGIQSGGKAGQIIGAHNSTIHKFLK